MPSRAALVRACITLLLSGASPAWSAGHAFPGDIGAGTIPDNSPVGLTIPFAVDGIDRDVFTVELRLQLAHTWAGDLDVVLASPDGRARLTLLAAVGANRDGSSGDSSNFSGEYRFTDRTFNNLWNAAASAATTNDTITPGPYRATSSGGRARSSNGGCPTSLTGVFGGLTPAQANGTWTLTLHDRASQDTGTVALAELIIVDPVLFTDGFDTPQIGQRDAAKGNTAAPHCSNKVVYDFTGDGLTDYVLARPIGTDIQWRVRENLGSGNARPEAEAVVFTLGNPGTDYVDSIDYDGDRIADATVWNPVTGTFHVRRSSRGIDPVVSIPLGQNGDDPLQSGDYDGDGRDDLAVFRAPAIDQPDGPMHIIVRATSSGAIRSIPVAQGVQGDAFVTGGFDMNGDHIADISVQEANPSNPAEGRFTHFSGRNGMQFAQFVLGNASDFVLPGNYVNEPRFDTTVRRTAGNLRYHRTRDAFGGTIAATEVQFGAAGDRSLGGDYDGDRLTDYAVWRSSTTPDQSRFIVRPSSDTATEWTVIGGSGAAPADVAVAGSRVK